MVLQSYLATLVLVFCIGIYEASFVLKEGIQNVFLAKYRLFENPKKALTKFCKKEETVKKGLFNCQVSYHWHQDKKWQEVCKTDPKRWFFPPRYYKIVLQCKLRDAPIKGLRSEWKEFY